MSDSPTLMLHLQDTYMVVGVLLASKNVCGEIDCSIG